MLNIISYAQSDTSFADRPFGAVDSLVLSQLAYLRYEGVDARFDSAPAPVAALAGLPLSHPLYANVRVPHSNRALLSAVAEGKRFAGLAYCRYLTQLDVDSEKQFSAVTFLLGDGTAYLAFRGTDATVVGWKEDLNMAFLEVVPSQLSAVRYIDAIAGRIDLPLRCGGHSKGGNLAIYAAAGCLPAHQARILNAYSHDGPGFGKAFFAGEGYAAIQARVHKTLPQSSIIGMLLQEQEAFSVVRSTKMGIMQHDPFSWLVLSEDFHYLQTVSRSAVFMDGTINRWLASITPARRGEFINTLYRIIRTTNAHTIDDLTAGWLKNATAVVGALRDLDPETRRFLLLTAVSLLKLAMDALKDTLVPAEDKAEMHQDKP